MNVKQAKLKNMQRKSLWTELLRWRHASSLHMTTVTNRLYMRSQMNSTCDKRLNNIMQALSKVLLQTELYTDISDGIHFEQIFNVT